MKNIQIYSEYCTGCGLCCSAEKIKFHINDNGFFSPELKDSHLKFCGKICPASGTSPFISNQIWGEYKNVFTGYSTDNEVRYSASSGGILTALTLFLLDKKFVDGILHIGTSMEDPMETKLYCSSTREEVMERCGSRYSQSAPLLNIDNIIDEGKKYCFIGKPCDVQALKNYLAIKSEYMKQIIYFFSFFCAGVSSNNAQKQLLEHMGCKEKCIKFTYRGSGWPGYSTAVDINGNIYRLNYEKSWGKILGRDVRKSCRFCLDGIGEYADISCADAWYLSDDKKPTFEERDGRNLIFIRSDKGNILLNEALKQGFVKIEDTDIDDLKHIQSYQYERRASMKARLQALKLMRSYIPQYNNEKCSQLSKCISWKYRLKIFLGTIKRIIKGKI